MKTIEYLKGTITEFFSSVIFLYHFLKEETTMSMVYVSLIVKGKKTFSQVPDRLKDEVRQILIDIDCEYLIDEE